MKLLTKEIRSNLPPLCSQDGKGEDAVAVVKFFNPTGAGTWYASEACSVLPDGTEVPLTDPRAEQAEDVIFFGVANITERELGYFSLNELQSYRGLGGLGIERDLHWKSRPLRECK